MLQCHRIFKSNSMSMSNVHVMRIISNLGVGAQQAPIPQPKYLICMENYWEKQQCQVDDSRLKYSSKYFMNSFSFWSNHEVKVARIVQRTFFLNNLRTSYRPSAPSPLNILVYFSTYRDIFLLNYDTTINVMKLMLMLHYHLILISH